MRCTAKGDKGRRLLRIGLLHGMSLILYRRYGIKHEVA